MTPAEQSAFAARVLERTPLDRATLAIIHLAQRFDLGDPRNADRYDELQRLILAAGAEWLDLGLGDKSQPVSESLEALRLTGAAFRMAEAQLREESRIVDDPEREDRLDYSADVLEGYVSMFERKSRGL